MKKIIWVLTLILTLGVVHAFAGGDGSYSNPFQISDCTELQEMNGSFTSHYQIVNNIDCSDTVNWNGGEGFVPIGYLNWDSISGSFNGNGYTISGLYMNKTDGDAVGLFIYIDGGDFNFTNVVFEDLTMANDGSYTGLLAFVEGGVTLNMENVTVNGAYVSGDQDIGTLIGEFAGDGTLTNLFVSDAYVTEINGGGGLFGLFSGTPIQLENVYLENLDMVITSSTNGHGGVVGNINNLGSTVSMNKVYSNGTMTSSFNVFNVGGIIGRMVMTNVNLTNVYSTMDFNFPLGAYAVGGIIGDAVTVSGNENLEYIYYAGTFNSGNGDDDDLGGIIADDSGISFTNTGTLFWDVNVSGTNDSDVGTPKTTAEMLTASTWSAFDTNVWTIGDGSYPLLQINDWQVPACTPNWTCIGYGTCNGTFQECNSVADTNLCGDVYTGDYGEFSPQACTIGGYVSGYVASDMDDVAIDGIVKFLIAIVGLAGLIGMVFLYKWGKTKVMRK